MPSPASMAQLVLHARGDDVDVNPRDTTENSSDCLPLRRSGHRNTTTSVPQAAMQAARREVAGGWKIPNYRSLPATLIINSFITLQSVPRTQGVHLTVAREVQEREKDGFGLG